MAKKKLEIQKISKFTKPNKVSRKVKKRSFKKSKKKTAKRSRIVKKVVILYSTPTCPWCKKAKEFLQEHKVDFKDFDVSADSKARSEMIKKSDQMGVPVLDIKGNIIVGYDIDKITQALKIRKKRDFI